MADLDELALALPQATKELSEDGRPAYRVHGKLFCCQRGRRTDALDPDTGERLDDVLMFRVPDLDLKELLLADDRSIFFTTPHFDGYPAVLVRIRAESRSQGLAGRALLRIDASENRWRLRPPRDASARRRFAEHGERDCARSRD
jgi:hypothetical protein